MIIKSGCYNELLNSDSTFITAKNAIKIAALNIAKFHKAQLPADIEVGKNCHYHSSNRSTIP